MNVKETKKKSYSSSIEKNLMENYYNYLLTFYNNQN